MKHNTIEIKLNSYGTLEVVTIPVKLYKDSYNVVKLRVNAPFKENSMLKVYASGRDEAGEQVWTSATYPLYLNEEISPIKIDGVNYNVYEAYMPQEFCTESGDIALTFTQVINNGGVEEVLTSGTLNLYISGEGFNYNGVKISDYDAVSIKINEALAYYKYKDYDLKIKTQSEFDSFIESLYNKTCTAKDILIIGGENYVLNLSAPLPISYNINKIDGANNATIQINDVSNVTLSYFIGYDTDYGESPDLSKAFRNIHFNCRVKGDTICLRGLIGLENVICNVYDVSETGGTLATAFSECVKLYKSVAKGSCRGFVGCDGLVECCTQHNIGGQAYTNCNNLVNCKADIVSNLYCYIGCSNLVNCKGGVARGYSSSINAYTYKDCRNIINCGGIGGKAVFYNCSNVSQGYKIDGAEEQVEIYSDCTFINATKEDIENSLSNIDVNVTADKVLDVLEDSESIVVGTNEDGSKISFHLDGEITSKISKSLVLPMSAPASTKLVAVDDGNSQTMLTVGSGLILQNGTLTATGTKTDIVQNTGSSTTAVMSQNAVTTQLNSLSNRIDNIGSTGSSVTVVDTLISQSTSDALSARQGNVLYNMVVDIGKEIDNAIRTAIQDTWEASY
jgi:hypothetical protein